MLFNAGLIHPVILLDNIAQPMQQASAFGTCLQTYQLQPNTDAFSISRWQNIPNLGIEYQRRFIRHGCKSQADKLVLPEIRFLLIINYNLSPAGGNIRQPALPISFWRRC